MDTFKPPFAKAEMQRVWASVPADRRQAFADALQGSPAAALLDAEIMALRGTASPNGVDAQALSDTFNKERDNRPNPLSRQK